MRSDLPKLKVLPAAVFLAAVLFSASAFAAKGQTFTGTVSDAMCGAKHMMEGSPAACLRACVQKGSRYALVVGDKVYNLDAKNKADLDTLDSLAGQQAKVKGE